MLGSWGAGHLPGGPDAHTRTVWDQSTPGPCLLPSSQGEGPSGWECQSSFSACDSTQAASRGAAALLALPAPRCFRVRASLSGGSRNRGLWCENTPERGRERERQKRGRGPHMADVIQLKILR